jgi:hypothetical protein
MREGPAVVAVEEEEGWQDAWRWRTAGRWWRTAVEEGGMAVEEEEGGTAGGWARRGLEGKAICSSRYELKASRLISDNPPRNSHVCKELFWNARPQCIQAVVKERVPLATFD